MKPQSNGGGGVTCRLNRSIELFFADDSPDSMVSAAIPFQWTGQILIFNRTQIKEALIREEAERPGVYMLVGELKGSRHLYVGEADKIKRRIKNHDSEKDWWNTAILVTSIGEPLNKAHSRYLEWKLHNAASRSKKVTLDNGKTPTSSPLSKVATVHMDDFAENIRFVLSALRFDFLTEDAIDREDTRVGGQGPSAPHPAHFVMRVPKTSLKARARVENGRFIVEKDSSARKNWISRSTRDGTYARLFRDLVNQGVLVDPEPPNAGYRKFEKDYVFTSPSAAASIVEGTMAPGTSKWRLGDITGKTYGQWEKENLDSLPDDKGTPE